MQTLANIAQQARRAAMQPQATTERQALDAAIKRAVNSTGFARAVGAMVAECLATEERANVLPPPCAATLVHNHNHDDLWVDSSDRAGWESYFYRVFDGQAAGFWRGSESRRDSTGRVWTHTFFRSVVDDFGTLVEVPA